MKYYEIGKAVREAAESFGAAKRAYTDLGSHIAKARHSLEDASRSASEALKGLR